MKQTPSNSPKLTLESAKCYEVILSTRDRIKCDHDELWRVAEGMRSGQAVKLRQGMIANPNFVVGIVEDGGRRASFVEEVRAIQQHNRQDRELYEGKDQKALPSGLAPLRDIFKGVSFEKSDTPKLTDGKPKLNAKNTG